MYFGVDSSEIQSGVIRLRMTFNTASAVIGTYGQGVLRDEGSHFYELSPLTQYKIKINAVGGYTLSILKEQKEYEIGSVELPFTLSGGSQMLYWDGKWYRGQVTIQRSHIGVIAVNHVSIDNLLKSVIGHFAGDNSSLEAIKASVVLLRSSLQCFQATNSPDYYDFHSVYLDYEGVSSEKQYVNRTMLEVQDEILVDGYGKLVCGTLRSAVTPNSFPFELIGYKNHSWEKVFTFSMLQRLLNDSGYNIEEIVKIEEHVISAQSKSVLSIVTSQGVIELQKEQAQDIFGLPSPFFKLYSYVDNNGVTRLQLIGSLAGFQQQGQHQSILNIVDAFEDARSYPGEDYESILENAYPNTYLIKI